MKNKIFLIFIFAISLIIISTTVKLVSADSNCNPNIQIVNQDPIPAIPDDYIKIIIEVSNLNNCNKFAVKLDPEYPFSLDPGYDPIQVLEQTPYSPNYKTTWDIPYKIRVASDTLEGDYELGLLYHEGNSKSFSTYSFKKDLNITITDARTDFATVIQDSSSSQVSIGIVNTGKNTANSLIVSIPLQDNFETTGTSQQIIGNLASGDYTIVSFSVTSKKSRPRVSSNATNPNKNMGSDIPSQISTNSNINNTLIVQLDYTDGIGKRRTVTKMIDFPAISSSSGNFTGNFSGGRFGTTSNGISVWWYVAGGILIIILVAGFIYIKRFKKSHHDKNSGKVIPDWILAEKGHHKK